MRGTGRPFEKGNTASARRGRPKGTPNKFTKLLREAILLAAENAGGKGGTVGYLTKQARENPQTFLPLLGKVLPLQIAGDPDNPVKHAVEIHIVDHRSDKG